ncbi:unnamed protein product [Lota lota]
MACSYLVKTLCVVLLYVHSCACGEAEIIGGEKVKAHSLPYMALLLNSTGEPVCGGTLLSSRWVLTAAHCSDIATVRLGVDTIKNSETDMFVQVQKVAKRYFHPNYDWPTKDHDLQLLKLDQEAKQTKTVKYLPLASVIPDPPEGTKCMVAGWGAVNVENKTMSDDLMSANVTVIKRETCNSPEYYNSDPVITPDMACAGTVGESQKDQDTCKGDSGGPLMCNGVQVGITSFGKGCAVRTKPGVYTFLSKQHIGWIKKTMQKPEFF